MEERERIEACIKDPKAEEQLREGNTIRVRPRGFSMRPLIVPIRDEIIATPLGEKNPKRGDLLVFKRPNNQIIIHRVHHVHQEQFYLIGDSQTFIEGPISKDSVLGMVDLIIRNGKEVNVNALSYKFLTGTWLVLRPLRPALSKFASDFKEAFSD